MILPFHFIASKLPGADFFIGNRKRVVRRLLLAILLYGQFSTGCTWAPTMVNQGVDAAIMVAEHRSFYAVAEDYAIKSEVDAKILDENLALDVRADVYQGLVLLTGVVHTTAERKRAEMAAKAVEAAREVFNEIKVSDENPIKVWLTGLFRDLKLKVKLIAAESVSSINYRWRTVNDVVYLLGNAASREEMSRVISIAQEMDGVHKVVSHIQFQSPLLALPMPPPSPQPPIYTVKAAKPVIAGTKAKPAKALAASKAKAAKVLAAARRQTLP